MANKQSLPLRLALAWFAIVLPAAAAPNFEATIARPLRYQPEGTDFVITNGPEYFNRPLYGPNTAFRVDSGDRPQFALYLPGRGGVLRLGVRVGDHALWLDEAAHITARYRPGSMLFAVGDPLLGAGTLSLTAIPSAAVDGLVVRVEPGGTPAGAELVWAYGGANGERGTRDVDIGTERQPVTRWFQLLPAHCQGNTFQLSPGGFTLDSKAASIAGLASAGATYQVADANQWAALSRLLAAANPAAPLPVVVGRLPLTAGQPVFVALQRVPRATDDRAELATYLEVRGEKPGPGGAAAPLPATAPAFTVENLPAIFAGAERHRNAVANQVVADTPDPFINAAVAALCVATNAVWDEASGTVQHGAVAWRAKLLGWRGPYANDELGWHDRATRDFAYWAGRQNAKPVPDRVPPADAGAASNLSRSETAIHSNGDMSNSHYDMNQVAVDAMLRHLLWTGDLAYARQLWPVLERHLAWERRLFRRPFGPGGSLPLYDSYANFWASDDVYYDGGGTTLSSAYNYFHNRMAARVATALGEDPTPYTREADLIWQAMHELLWLPDRGWYGENKDWLGRQAVHPSPALWSFYTAIDSGAATPEEALQMCRFVDTQIAHIPLRGPGVPDEGDYTMPTTNWLPYAWSTNNVVMAEVAHTSLAYWEAGRGDEAFKQLKGAMLDSMFMGLCPGNLGAMTHFDMARGETQRDFGDACGTVARAVVEGLFGVRPDGLAGELLVQPGFPAAWDHAALRHPDFDFSYKREGLAETYAVEQKFAKPMALRLQIGTLRDGIASVTVNGEPEKWRRVTTGGSRLEITCAPAGRQSVRIVWQGDAPVPARPLPTGVATADMPRLTDWARLPAGSLAQMKFETVSLTAFFNDKVTEIYRHDYLTPRAPFATLSLPKQGIGTWCRPTATADINDTGVRAAAGAAGVLTLPQGVPLATPGPGGAKNIAFVSQWDNFPHELAVPLAGRAAHAYFLMAGSTNSMQSRFDNGEVVVAYADGTADRLALENPTTWWPIEEDYKTDEYAFRRTGPLPIRVNLRTGQVRVLDEATFEGQGGKVAGGAATVLDLALDPAKELRSLTVRALANDVVIGLMSVTLAR
jgi:hypothetical protein